MSTNSPGPMDSTPEEASDADGDHAPASSPRRKLKPPRGLPGQGQARKPLPIIVGIGASAGGLEALQEFFDCLPSGEGCAFVVVQHLSPDFKSLMDEILSRHTSIQVTRVTESVKVQSEHIYLLPPRTNILLEGDEVHIEPQDPQTAVQRPIDVFFRSMAQTCGTRCIAIVLSGTGSDGSRGIAEVKAQGGFVISQAPETSKFDGMPAAAVATGSVDLVLSPANIANTVRQLITHGGLLHSEEPDEAPKQGSALDRILESIRTHTAFDFRTYKKGTIRRRIDRRMRLHLDLNIDKYAERLQRDPKEADLLARDCLIHVTRFFRDPEAYARLAREVKAAIARKPHDTEPFRVWVAGCSTGEEPYSIGMVITQALREAGSAREFKIFATDLVQRALDTASRGAYDSAIQEDLGDYDFQRFFQVENGVATVEQNLRRAILFSRHDLIKDPPFARCDLVVCRNLLIYFGKEAQRRALERLLFATRVGGILFLGSSETAEAIGPHVETLDPKWRIYSKLSELQHSPSHTNFAPSAATPTSSRQRPAHEPRSELPLVLACEQLVGLFADAGVIASEDGEVLHTFGNIGHWLVFPSGPMSTNIKSLLPENLYANVSLAIRHARATREPVSLTPKNDNKNTESASIDVVAVPSRSDDDGLICLLIGRQREAPVQLGGLSESELESAVRIQIETLEGELRDTRENLQTTIEELETTNEEMQSVNEELLSSNEELQSTNEELHSVNEELYTVNAEHQDKIAQLVHMTEDLEFLMAATDIGMIRLDTELRVTRFTSSASMAVPLRDQDKGRSLSELASRTEGVDLGEFARQALVSGRPQERRVMTDTGKSLLARINPCRTGLTTVEGVVLTFVDITELDEVQKKQQEQASLLDWIEQSSTDCIWVRDFATLSALQVGPAIESIWGLSVERCLAQEQAWRDAIHPDDRDAVIERFRATKSKEHFETEYRVIRPDGTERYVRDRCFGSLASGFGSSSPIIVSVPSDITEQVHADRERQQRLEVHRQTNELLPLPILHLNSEGQIEWGNQKAAEWIDSDFSASATNFCATVKTDKDRTQVSAAISEVSASSDAPTKTLRVELGSEQFGYHVVDLMITRIEVSDSGARAAAVWVDRRSSDDTEPPS